MTCTKNLLLIFLLTSLFATASIGQESRPKIGLVLSGGGAKGMAHIGVLKAMEEAGLKPDYITGTSMGSIIGGLYSIGYTPDELYELVTTADWDQILTNKVPLNKVIFEEKPYYGRYLLEMYFDDGEPVYPSGVIDGQALMALFSDLTRPVHEIRDFNRFPIPFACVAADIAAGEPVLLNKGSLALSMRASMAIPTVFTPVRIDGKLLVDGGLVRNMPVQEVIDMGADIVIGVYVGGTLHPEEELKSLVSILTQSAFITSIRDAEEQIKKCDVLIEPNLQGYSASSFHDADSIVGRGLTAGYQYLDTFRHLADSLMKLGPLHEVEKPEITDTFVFRQILVEGNRDIDDGFIVGRLGFKAGEAVSIEQLSQRLDFIFGSQYFNKIYYEILGDPGEETLKITVEERPETQFRLSYHYDRESNGGIIGNATFRNLILKRSRLIFEADISGQPSVSTDYFKYLGKKQMYAVGANILYNDKELPAYENDIRTYLFESKYIEAGLRLQSSSVRNSTFGVELKRSGLRLRNKIPSEQTNNISKVRYQSSRWELFYRYNSLNARYFPTNGLKASILFANTFATDGSLFVNDQKTSDEVTKTVIQAGIYSLAAEALHILPLSPRFSLIGKTRLHLSSLKEGMLNLSEIDFVGGFTPDMVNAHEFWGARKKEYLLTNYFLARLGGQYELKRNLYLQAQVNYLSNEFLIESIYPDSSRGTINGRSNTIGYGLMLGTYSPIGPIEFMLAKDHYLSGIRVGLRVGFY